MDVKILWETQELESQRWNKLCFRILLPKLRVIIECYANQTKRLTYKQKPLLNLSAIREVLGLFSSLPPLCPPRETAGSTTFVCALTKQCGACKKVWPSWVRCPVSTMLTKSRYRKTPKSNWSFLVFCGAGWELNPGHRPILSTKPCPQLQCSVFKESKKFNILYVQQYGRSLVLGRLRWDLKLARSSKQVPDNTT